MKTTIASALVQALNREAIFITGNAIEALYIIDQLLCPANLTLEPNDKGQLRWRCDAGTIIGEGMNRVEAIEDVLRQILAKRKAGRL